MDASLVFLKSFAGLFAIVDPLGVIPIFVALSATMSVAEKSGLIKTASLTVLVVLLTAALFGEWLLSALGVRISAFQVGGGILLLLMGIPMMQASSPPTRSTRNEEREMENANEVGAVPIGIPLLAGPAALSHVIIVSHDAKNLSELSPLLVAIVAVACSTWIILKMSKTLSEKMGVVGIGVSMRIMGLVLSAIAVETMAKGLAGLFPKVFS